jgi:hypothetical protein
MTDKRDRDLKPENLPSGAERDDRPTEAMPPSETPGELPAVFRHGAGDDNKNGVYPGERLADAVAGDERPTERRLPIDDVLDALEAPDPRETLLPPPSETTAKPPAGDDGATDAPPRRAALHWILTRGPIWLAINAYAEVCGGDTSGPPIGERRNRAVAAVESALDTFVGAPATSPAASPAEDTAAPDAPPPSDSPDEDDQPTDAPPPSDAAAPGDAQPFGSIRQMLRAEELHTASLTDLLFYAVADQSGEGTLAILRPARDELRAIAALAITSEGGEDLLTTNDLGAALDAIVRRMDVVVELLERATVAKRAEASVP